MILFNLYSVAITNVFPISARADQENDGGQQPFIPCAQVRK